DLGVHRHHRGDDLHFVAEAIGEQRADRAIDQARSQRLLFGRAALALEEAARNAATGVELLLVVDGEREEVLPLACGLVGDRADQQHGALARDHDRAAGLACDLTGLDGDRATAVLEALGNFRHVGDSSVSLAMNRPGPLPLAGWRTRGAPEKEPRRISAPRRGVYQRRRPSFPISA